MVRSQHKNVAFSHCYLWKGLMIVCIGGEWLLLPPNDSGILTCCSECMFPLIETSLCALALWVDVSSGLGRNLPSSYPSREQFAAKTEPALNKPSHGTGQRAGKDTEGETKGKGEAVKIKISCQYGTNMVVRMCFVSFFSPFFFASGFENGIWSIQCAPRPPTPRYCVCNEKKNKTLYSYSCQYFPHMSSTRPPLPTLNLLSLSRIISRHKHSVCHSRLCSERPLSAYLYKMWICNSTVMKATLVTSFQHIIFPQTHCETRSNRCVKALFILRGCQEGCGKTQRFCPKHKLYVNAHTDYKVPFCYSLFISPPYPPPPFFFEADNSKKDWKTQERFNVLKLSYECLFTFLSASRGSDFCRQFVSGNWSLSTAVECILGTISGKKSGFELFKMLMDPT